MLPGGLERSDPERKGKGEAEHALSPLPKVRIDLGKKRCSTPGGLERSDKQMNGERGWIRTSDPRLKRALLYQLSYAPTHN